MSGIRIRTQELGPGRQVNTSDIYFPEGYGHSGELSSRTLSEFRPLGRRITGDQKNSWPPKKGNMFDLGAEYTSSSWRWVTPGASVSYQLDASGLSGRRTYSGFHWPVPPWALGPLVTPSTSALNVWGTKAVNQSIPTAPQAGVAVALGELRQLPQLPILGLYKMAKDGVDIRQFIRRVARGSGHEYLNITFGWLPLEKDLRDFHESTKKASKTVDFLLKNSGKVVRRRRTIHENSETTSVEGAANSVGSGPPGTYLAAISKLQTEITDVTKVWSSCAFTYFITAGEGYFSVVKRNEQVLNVLYGTRITPAVLWNLAPWSWAIDWVGNIGEIVENFSAFSGDSLVMKYGYLMFSREVTTTRRLTVGLRAKVNGPQSGTTSVSAVSKQVLHIRKRANPYGFGSGFTGLSVRQAAIVGALGLTKVRS